MPEAEVISLVTTVSPMKRGLKARQVTSLIPKTKRYNRFPDEKGTESSRLVSSGEAGLMLQPFPR